MPFERLNMIRFAKYVGKECFQDFIPGCVYALDNSIRGVEVIDFACFQISGKTINISLSDDRFRFMKEAYAVWDGTGPPIEKYAGQVIRVTDLSDGFLFSPGHGFLSTKHVRLVGSDILYPEIRLMCRRSRKWSVVSCVSESFDVCLGRGKLFHPLTKFLFPFSNGVLVKNASVVCRDAFLSGIIKEGSSGLEPETIIPGIISSRVR